MRPIVLASASAARAKVLAAAGVAFQVEVSGLDEAPFKARCLAEGCSAAAIADGLAQLKALAVAAPPGGVVIGADQTLEVGGEQLDKSRDLAETRRVLQRLRGVAFQLHAAVALAEDGQITWAQTHSVRLTMRSFSDGFLDAYLARNADRLAASLGGFELEAEGSQLFETIEGDYFAVLGLPLLPLMNRLRAIGALPA